MLDLLIQLFYLFVLLLTVSFVTAAVLTRRMCHRRPLIVRSESERYYLDRRQGRKVLFPLSNYFKQSEIEKVSLSVIVPAFNEEKRLPVMLDEAIAYLESRQKTSSMAQPFTYEIIVVDDGSTDKTSQVVLRYSDEWTTDKVRLLKLEKNRGKGGAVRLGVLAARGLFMLFADADGATKFSELEKLEAALSSVDGSPLSNRVLAVGSRAHLEQEAIASRSSFRTLLMHGFHFLVWISAVRTVRDTQCGFKLFPRDVALLLFSSTHIERWAFDVELLFLAERLGLKVHEVCVQWTEVAGSKIVPVFSWLQMGRDVLAIAFLYLVRAWVPPDEAEVRSTLSQHLPDKLGTIRKK